MVANEELVAGDTVVQPLISILVEGVFIDFSCSKRLLPALRWH